MKITPTAQEIASVASLKAAGEHRWLNFMAMVRRTLEETRKASDALTGTDLAWNQGHAQILQDVVTLEETAADRARENRAAASATQPPGMDAG